MTGSVRRVVVVGASVAGLTTAEALRSEGFAGDITLVGAETHAPYQRPPLSKQVLLGAWTPDQVALRDHDELRALDLALLLGTRAHGLDPQRRVVRAGGRDLPYEALVIATGSTPRSVLPASGAGRRHGQHTLRTVDDAVALREDLCSARRLVVVGGGVLGSEIASAACSLGVSVTMVEHSGHLGFGHLGSRLSSRLLRLHERRGVGVVLGTGVVGVSGEETVSGVHLSDGSWHPADVVVEAVGCRPAVDWLAACGLDVTRGVRCDDSGTAAPGIYAVGDVAAWRAPGGGPGVRTEHQSSAVEQAVAVARLIATGERSAPLPGYFWSELHGTRIQAYGRFDGDRLDVIDEMPPEGSDDGSFTAVSRERGRVVGVVGWNAGRSFRDARREVAA